MHSRTNMNWRWILLWFYVILFRQTPPVFRWPRPELRHDWHGRGRWRGRLWPRRRPRPPRRRRRLLGRSLFLRNLLQVSTPAEPSQENMHQDRLESVSTVKLHKRGPLLQTAGNPLSLLLSQPSSALLSVAQAGGPPSVAIGWATKTIIFEDVRGHKMTSFFTCKFFGQFAVLEYFSARVY